MVNKKKKIAGQTLRSFSAVLRDTGGYSVVSRSGRGEYSVRALDGQISARNTVDGRLVRNSQRQAAREARELIRLSARARSADTDLETLVAQAEEIKRRERVQAQRRGLAKLRQLRGMDELAKITGAENTKATAG